MPNFLILYVSAAVLALSAMLTLGVVALWVLGERRLGDAAQFHVADRGGSSGEALAVEPL